MSAVVRVYKVSFADARAAPATCNIEP